MSDSKSATPGKEKKVSDKDLDLTNANRGVWLVKVPKYLADRWESTDAPVNIGKLTISRKVGTRPIVSFTLDDKVVTGGTPDAEQIPKEHKFNVAKVIHWQSSLISLVIPTPLFPFLISSHSKGKLFSALNVSPFR